MKKVGTDTAMRANIHLNLPPHLVLEMFTNMGLMEWRPEIKAVELLKDWGPNDRVIRLTPDLPWAIKYIMSVPEQLTFRIIKKTDFPEVGD